MAPPPVPPKAPALPPKPSAEQQTELVLVCECNTCGHKLGNVRPGTQCQRLHPFNFCNIVFIVQNTPQGDRNAVVLDCTRCPFRHINIGLDSSVEHTDLIARDVVHRCEGAYEPAGLGLVP